MPIRRLPCASDKWQATPQDEGKNGLRGKVEMGLMEKGYQPGDGCPLGSLAA